MTAIPLSTPSALLLPPRRRAALLLVLGVLAGHAALLSGARTASLQPDTGPARAGPHSVQVRRVSAAPAAAPERPVVASTAAAGPSRTNAVARAPAVPPREAAIKPLTVAASPAPTQGDAAAATPRPETPLPEAGTAPDPFDAVPADAPAAPQPNEVAIPVYATLLPPPTTLRYALHRGGAATGQAELRWQPADGRYELALSGPAFTAQRRAWVSRGGIDAHGIAPERYAEARRGRELRAVNFQRDSGRITFSGPQHEFALVPGAQDRLSWMLQLAAIVAADPALQVPGARVTMLVAGTRGAADAWDFAAVAHEAVEPSDTADAAPRALRWRREAVRAWDTEVDVWLDPQRHHLPVRARLRVPGSGASSEFTLLQMTAP